MKLSTFSYVSPGMNIIKNLSSLFQQPQRYDGYSFSRREHYQNILNPKDIVDMANKYMKLHNNRYETDVSINFGGREFGMSMSILKQQNPKPRYVIENYHNDAIKHSVFFYREKLGKHRAVSQFHFVDEVFLWGMYLFNNYLLETELKEIEAVLFEKYKIKDALNLKDVIIKDKNDNMIQLINEVYTSIHYMTGNKSLIENLSKKANSYQGLVRIPSTQEQKSLFEKL